MHPHLTEDVATLGLLGDRRRCEEAAGVALSMLVTRLDRGPAQRLAEALPGEVPLEQLRAPREGGVDMTVTDCVGRLAERLGLARDDARTVLTCVVRGTRERVATPVVMELAATLPRDWARLVAEA